MKLRRYLALVFFLLLVQCTHTKWQAVHHTKHPLVGKILDTQTGNFVDFTKFEAFVVEKKPNVIFLGEVHNHPDHHMFHLKILKSLFQNNLLGTLFLEHFNLDQNADLKKALSSPDPFNDFDKKLKWGKGWDAFSFYEPMLRLAWQSHQEIKGVNLSRKDLKNLVNKRDPMPISASEYKNLLELPSITPLLKNNLAEEIVRSHCHMFGKEHAEPIVKAQVLRDKVMTISLLKGLAPEKISVFIGGNGHMVKDRGVPFYLKGSMASLKVVSVAFFPVNPEQKDKSIYLKQPYDFIFFTPVFDPTDPCEKYKKHLQKMQIKH